MHGYPEFLRHHIARNLSWEDFNQTSPHPTPPQNYITDRRLSRYCDGCNLERINLYYNCCDLFKNKVITKLSNGTTFLSTRPPHRHGDMVIIISHLIGCVKCIPISMCIALYCTLLLCRLMGNLFRPHNPRHLHHSFKLNIRGPSLEHPYHFLNIGGPSKNHCRRGHTIFWRSEDHLNSIFIWFLHIPFFWSR